MELAQPLKLVQLDNIMTAPTRVNNVESSVLLVTMKLPSARVVLQARVSTQLLINVHVLLASMETTLQILVLPVRLIVSHALTAPESV